MKTLALHTESTSRSQKFILFSYTLMKLQYYFKPIVSEWRPRNTETCLKAYEATLLKAIPAFVKEPGQIISSAIWSDVWFSWICPKDLCPPWCDEPLACLFGTWMWEPCTGPNGGGELEWIPNPDCRERLLFIVIHLMPVLSECSGTTSAPEGMRLTVSLQWPNRFSGCIYTSARRPPRWYISPF